jgi:hypothetical protein
MTDYAASPVQPIVQGLLTITPETDFGPGVVSFFGIGIVTSGPNAPRYVSGGRYLLTLDPGLPGDVAIDPPFGRYLLTVRAPAPSTPTNILSKALTYIVNPVPGVGTTQIEITVAIGSPPVSDDPDGPNRQIEIIIWRGDAGVEPTNVNIVGGPGVIVIP